MLDGAAVLPQRGDVIREEQNGQVYVYEVNAPGQEPHFRYRDLHRRTLRIHTKQIDQGEKAVGAATMQLV